MNDDKFRIDVDALEELTVFVRDCIEERLGVQLRDSPHLWSNGRWSIHFLGLPDPHECVCGGSLWETIKRAEQRIADLNVGKISAERSEQLRQAACAYMDGTA